MSKCQCKTFYLNISPLTLDQVCLNEYSSSSQEISFTTFLCQSVSSSIFHYFHYQILKPFLNLFSSSSSQPVGPLAILPMHAFLKKKYFIYLFLEGEGGRKRNTNVWLSLTHPVLGTWPVTQACALTGNRTCDPLLHRPELNPLSHTSQDPMHAFYNCPLLPS